mmetsp:Transcript_66492/g.183677  ORF Transcript_66492/g.183677 Transcript_66492/m.183677 type:complete len:118 (+) Transcript_66492:626-979(+)
MHAHFPDTFKAQVRALLLCRASAAGQEEEGEAAAEEASNGNSGNGSGSLIGSLPMLLVERIIADWAGLEAIASLPKKCFPNSQKSKKAKVKLSKAPKGQPATGAVADAGDAEALEAE